MKNEMENLEHNQATKSDDNVLADVCERCHREYVLNSFNIQSVDVSLCDECYRTELAKKIEQKTSKIEQNNGE